MLTHLGNTMGMLASVGLTAAGIGGVLLLIVLLVNVAMH